MRVVTDLYGSIGHIHVSESLPSMGWAHNQLEDEKDLPVAGRELRERLEVIRGIEGVGTGRKEYELYIYKGEAFPWDDIIPKVLAVLRAHFHCDSEIELTSIR